MAGRPTKLNDQIVVDLVNVISTGATVSDACTHVGIGKATYYEWLAIGEACLNETEHDRKPESEAERLLFAEFADTITRAHARTKVLAIAVLRGAMSPHEQVTETIETFTETRLRRDVSDKGEPIQVPYEYTEQRTRRAVTKFAPDYHAALEYLKRRHPEEWSDRLKIDDWRSAAIGYIKAGEITYEALVDELGQSLADELFTSAGVPIGATGANPPSPSA